MNHSETDCRSETGITVGLVDALISIARILSKRDLSPSEVREALDDANGDTDLAVIFPKLTLGVFHSENGRTVCNGCEVQVPFGKCRSNNDDRKGFPHHLNCPFGAQRYVSNRV